MHLFINKLLVKILPSEFFARMKEIGKDIRYDYYLEMLSNSHALKHKHKHSKTILISQTHKTH